MVSVLFHDASSDYAFHNLDHSMVEFYGREMAVCTLFMFCD